MKIEQTRNGKYRVRPYINGKRQCITFEHKPTQKDIKVEIEKLEQIRISGNSLYNRAEAYIELKESVLSPSTIRGYRQMIKNISDDIADKDILQITQVDIQKEISQFAVNHSAKTTKNYHSFLSAVLRLYNPELILRTTLPKGEKKKPYIPTNNDVQRILDYECGSKYYVPFKLMCYGLRRSEVCAIHSDDLDGNILHIHRAKVQTETNEWIIKETTKTEASTRDLPIDDELAGLIRDIDGFVFTSHPNKLYRRLNKDLKELGIESFSLHKLRHYFASKLNEQGVDSKTIQALGGWETDNVMKSVYEHSINPTKKGEVLKEILFN